MAIACGLTSYAERATFPGMPSTTKRKRPTAPEATKIQFRFSEQLIADLDKWTEELNEGRPWPPMTRSDLVRDVLLWAVRTRPNFKSGT